MGLKMPIEERLRRAHEAQRAVAELLKVEPPKGRAHGYWLIQVRKYLTAARREAAAVVVVDRYGKHPRYPNATEAQIAEAEAVMAWADGKWRI